MTLFSAVALFATACASFAEAGPPFSPPPTLTPNVATVIPPDGLGAAASGVPDMGGPGQAPPAGAPGAPADPCAPPDLPVVAVCLDAPWGLAPLPGGDSALVGERASGRILTVQAATAPAEFATIAGVDASRGGGLLGLALSPYYTEDGLVYAYVTSATGGRVLRLAAGQQPKAIVEGLPAGDGTALGGGLLFDGDGLLYITTPGGSAAAAGGASAESSAASSGAAAGSAAGAAVLRVDTFGHPAEANSSHTAQFARGFTNPTGMCLLADGGVGVVDHRASGDVLIEIEDGGDYRALEPGDAVWTYSAGDGGAADCAVADGQLLATSRIKPRVTAIQLRRGGGFTGSPQVLLDGEYGLLRTAVPGPGDMTWMTTANIAGSTAGAAKGAAASDDRVIVLPPSSVDGGSGGVD